MLLRVRIILFFVMVFSGVFSQQKAGVRIWSMKKGLNQFYVNDSIFFRTDDSLCVMKIRLNGTGTLDQCDCRSGGDMWSRKGSWSPEPGKLLIETDSARFVLRLTGRTTRALTFIVEQRSERNRGGR